MAGGPGTLPLHGGRILHADEVPPDLAATWGAAHGDWFGAGRRALPNAPDRPHLALVDSPLGPVVAKREAPRGWKRPLVRVGARGHRAERAFRHGHALLERGLSTPTPLACIALPGSADAEAVLVTRWVDARDPWSFLTETGGDLEELLATLAGELARLHAAGYRHRDLKAPNVLVRRGDAGALEVLWIDLDGLAARRVGGALRQRDLARLCASFETPESRRAGVRADAWPRFVQRYLEAAGGAGLEAEDVVLSTRRWARQHIERNLLRRRPLS
jgi:tRNA A-37 threonylcarbamoyl transferase component Bud32